jgi:hypothetical protein
MQDAFNPTTEDPITGQQHGWRPSGITTQSGTITLKGDSLYGRLKANWMFAPDTYVILVHDNGAGWGDPSTATIHEKFAQFVKAKVGPATERMVVAGYSRGGILAAAIGKHLRSSFPLPNSLPIYVGIFDGVAGGSFFGVDTSTAASVLNPLMANDEWRKETTAAEKQFAAAARLNSTFYFDHVSGGRVVVDPGTIHGFGSRNADIIPNYWTEHWDTIPHTNYKDWWRTSHMYDPFIRWMVDMNDAGRNGWYGSTYTVTPISTSTSRTYYVDARAGGYVYFLTTWSASRNANINIEVTDPTGAIVVRGTSTSTSLEEVYLPTTRTGRYKVRVFSVRGSADVTVSHATAHDPARIGRIYVPREIVNAASGFKRSYNVLLTPGANSINLELSWDLADADLDLRLKNQAGTIVARSETTRRVEKISYPVSGTGQKYTIEVISKDTRDVEFELNGAAPLYTN